MFVSEMMEQAEKALLTVVDEIEGRAEFSERVQEITQIQGAVEQSCFNSYHKLIFVLTTLLESEG